jgi:hypothetical protein
MRDDMLGVDDKRCHRASFYDGGGKFSISKIVHAIKQSFDLRWFLVAQYQSPDTAAVLSDCVSGNSRCQSELKLAKQKKCCSAPFFFI